MSECKNCARRVPSVTDFALGTVAIQHCVECGQLIRARYCSAVGGSLSGLCTEPAESISDIEETVTRMPSIYMVVHKDGVADSLRDELADVKGIDFQAFVTAQAALSQFVIDVRDGHERKLVIFHPSVANGAGTAFVYGVRAVEMGLGASQVPILILGDASSAQLDRCIEESKNARFVSIGAPKNDVELVKRYLKVVDKLAKR